MITADKINHLGCTIMYSCLPSQSHQWRSPNCLLKDLQAGDLDDNGDIDEEEAEDYDDDEENRGGKSVKRKAPFCMMMKISNKQDSDILG